MARPSGRRNADFEQKRAELTERARVALLERGAGASFRELAEATGASVTNLKHYFGDRDGLFEAISAELQRRGQPFMDNASVPRSADPHEALRRFLQELVTAWRFFGVGRVFAVGLAEGLGSERRGPAYVSHLLEPTLQSCEGLLGALVEGGSLPPLDRRAGALALVGPVVLGLLHQDALFGAACRPLDVDAFVEAHVGAWLQGYARPTPPPPDPCP